MCVNVGECVWKKVGAELSERGSVEDILSDSY